MKWSLIYHFLQILSFSFNHVLCIEILIKKQIFLLTRFDNFQACPFTVFCVLSSIRLTCCSRDYAILTKLGNTGTTSGRTTSFDQPKVHQKVGQSMIKIYFVNLAFCQYNSLPSHGVLYSIAVWDWEKVG